MDDNKACLRFEQLAPLELLGSQKFSSIANHVLQNKTSL